MVSHANLSVCPRAKLGNCLRPDGVCVTSQGGLVSQLGDNRAHLRDHLFIRPT